MKETTSKEPLRLIVTAKGNHLRHNTNIRELESLVESGFQENTGGTVGFVTPFVNQKTAAKDYLPQEYIRDTVHKFQGRECEEMIFSTVLDKKVASKFKMKFVDDDRLVNVAVSRAKERFTLVTGNAVFEKNNRSIAALIRYMRYYAEQEYIVESNVISAFDLLYTEYDKSLNKLKRSLRKEDSKFVSEQIMAELLRKALEKESLDFLNFHREIYLNKLVSASVEFSDEERKFMRHGARCDFVLFYKVGKVPFLVIEVDGSYHDEPGQQRRDQLKDSILKKAGIPIYRARTHIRMDVDKINKIIVSNLK